MSQKGLRQYECGIFDLDGTLIDSRLDLTAAVNHTRRDLSLGELPVEAVLANVGRGARYLLQNSIPESKVDFEELWPVFSAHYVEHMLDNTVLYPGVAETLAELDRRGWKMGVNTNKPSFATGKILEHFGIARYFGRGVVAGGDCAEMKPSALPLRECAARIGHVLDADDWMVGDSWVDMQCAEAAGVKGAFCEFGFGELRASRCDARLDRFERLLDVLPLAKG
jgi:phosphoglycolate phosphatase